MRYDENVVVAFDFDNTLTSGSTYLGTGSVSKTAVYWFWEIRKLGVVTVLWTTREGDDLAEAVYIMKQVGVEFDYVNSYPLREPGRKLNADVYIDDKANDGKLRWWRTYRKVKKLVKRKERGDVLR